MVLASGNINDYLKHRYNHNLFLTPVIEDFYNYGKVGHQLIMKA